MTEDIKKWLSDGGLKSRKLWICLLAMFLVFIGSFIAAKWPAFAANYEAMIGGILGAAGLYTGTSVIGRWTTGKHVIGSMNTQSTEKRE